MSAYEEEQRRALEKRAHEAEITQTKIQAAALAVQTAAFAQQAIQQARQHEEMLAEEQAQTRRLDEQSQILRMQAAREEEHLAFTKDIQWLERSNAKGRVEYLLEPV